MTHVVYDPIPLVFEDRNDWDLSTILSLRAKENPDKTFLAAPPEASLSYGEVDELTSRVAGGLQERGVAQGDRVLILLDNCPEFILAWFGATRAGAVEVPVNTQYFGDFLLHCVDSAKPCAVVVGANYASRIIDLRTDLARWSLRVFVADHAALDDGRTVHDVVDTLQQAGFDASPFSDLTATPCAPAINTSARSDMSAILFTSGTTGPSKGVMLSHAQLYFMANACVRLVQLGPDDTYMTAMPLFHGNAQFLTVYPALITGATVALYRRFSPARFSARLRESGATVTNFLGVMMDWVAKQEPDPRDGENRLRVVHAGPTAWSAVPLLRERFGIEAFVEAFGQTEIGLPIMARYGVDRPEGSAGVGVEEWFDLRLADPDTDEEVPIGEVGELQIRPKEDWTLTLGYFGLPDQTAQAQRNLWFHTGDGLRRDAAGNYFFVDRIKDCIRRRGENISSYEVEQPMLKFPEIASCALIGLPADEEAGEDELALFVVASPDHQLGPERVLEFAESALPSYLVPRYVQIVSELPMTPNGKIQKAALRKVSREELHDRVAHRKREPVATAERG